MRFFTKKAPERAFPGAHTGSGYTRFAHGATAPPFGSQSLTQNREFKYARNQYSIPDTYHFAGLRLPIFHGAIRKRLRIWLRLQSSGSLDNRLCRLLLIYRRHPVPARVSGNEAFLRVETRGPLAHGNGGQQNPGAVLHNRVFASPANIRPRSSNCRPAISKNLRGMSFGSFT